MAAVYIIRCLETGFGRVDSDKIQNADKMTCEGNKPLKVFSAIALRSRMPYKAVTGHSFKKGGKQGQLALSTYHRYAQKTTGGECHGNCEF